MNKKISLTIIMLMSVLITSSLVSAQFSEDRIDYYNDSVFVLADGLESESDIAINGINMTDGLSTTAGGWTIADAAGEYTNEISDAPKGDLSMKIFFASPNNVGARRFLPSANASFEGVCEVQARWNSTFSVGSGQHVVQFNSPVGGTFSTGLQTFVSTSDYACNSGACDVSFPMTFDAWVPLKYNFTQSPAGIEFYANNTKIHTDTDNQGLNFIFFISASQPGGFYVDDFYCYNGDERPLAATPSNPPTITLLLPEMNNLYNNDPLPINYVGEALDGFNKTEIYVNGTLNKTLSTLSNTTIEIGEGLFDITVGITDSNQVQTNATNTGIIVDRTSPSDDVLAVVPDELFTDQLLNITATDDNLYGHNVTLYDFGGNLLQSFEAINISTQTNTFTITIDVSALGVGTYTIVSNESDDHTARRIPAYNVRSSAQNQRIGFDHDGESVDVVVKSAKQGAASLALQAISHMKQTDRYRFGFEFNGPPGVKDYVFEVTTTEDYYIRNTGYSAHVVTGERWIDFEPYVALVTPIDSRTYEVAISTTDSELTFESIGGVNRQATSKTFSIVAPTATGVTCNDVACSSILQGETISTFEVFCTNTTSAFLQVLVDNSTLFANSSIGFTGMVGGVQQYTAASSGTYTGNPYTATGYCINELGTAIATSAFTPAAPPVPTPEPTLANFRADLFAKTLITLLIAILIFVVIRQSMKIRGGAR